MNDERKLTLGFHGRIIDHLGIQMYQSPTAAIAEIISNAWDADAESVSIDFCFPDEHKSNWTITVVDDGCGMTLDECQSRFLTVGYNRREDKGPGERTGDKDRPVMGRKGIGKFAGFGIARFIKIRTVSKATGQLTEFELDLSAIRRGDSYVSTEALEIAVHHVENSGLPHGTTITLRDLKLSARLSESQFGQSLARRFVINSNADNFAIFLNKEPIPSGAATSNIEMQFPRDLPGSDIDTRKVSIGADGWGVESLPSGREVKWRVLFMKDLVKDTELQGVTIFAHRKLAQRAFLFNITGGTASQAGPEYMSGQVIADWVDELGEDIISTERQRLNWEHAEVAEFQRWGESLIRRLLSVWKDRRTQQKMQALEHKVNSFAERIAKLGGEGRTVKRALSKLAQIEKLNTEQFADMGNAILLAWEGGRLRDLIDQISQSESLDEAGLVEILAEANAITALHTAETVKAKLTAIQGLEKRVAERELENAVRDYIAKNPWLISPIWETFASETRVRDICVDAAAVALKDEAFKGRVDLALSSGNQLLVLEFMRPGLKLDRDHLDRFNRYLDIIQEKIDASTGLELNHLTGYLVADDLERQAGNRQALKDMRSKERFALSWKDLIAQSKHQWREFLEHIKERVPDDERVRAIAEHDPD